MCVLLQFCVVIMVDGREKMAASLLEYLHMGVRLWDPTVIRQQHKGNEVTAHVFQRAVVMPKDGYARP